MNMIQALNNVGVSWLSHVCGVCGGFSEMPVEHGLVYKRGTRVCALTAGLIG